TFRATQLVEISGFRLRVDSAVSPVRNSAMTTAAFHPWVRARVCAGLLLLLALPAAAAQDDLLAQAYAAEVGENGPPDLSAAVVLYQRAAEAGDPHAHFRLGLMRETGEGLPHD